MLVYHFINAEFGLEAIKRQRIKVSKLNDLNDPFELFSIDVSDNEHRKTMRSFKRFYADSTLILCFSKSWKSPLLWSHYADRHKGIALEFEIPDSLLFNVKYQKKRIQMDKVSNRKFSTVSRMLLTTKYIEWKYEDESRMFLNKQDVINEKIMSFIEFSNELKLKSIILGSLSTIKLKTVIENMPEGTSITVLKSRMAFKEFHIVRDRGFKIKTIHKPNNVFSQDEKNAPAN